MAAATNVASSKPVQEPVGKRKAIKKAVGPTLFDSLEVPAATSRR